ncbi:uncharacterized protein N7496_002513 [Penicillium cataractarum]|uniref:DUF159 domain protein n=1 Tax=Penicillium cataractarum TaxID=2100454 RepID=A0A9W9SLE2_9EURO|nr:uncharacterized protein N7496_002513 [Penicillium cataractarum]KAJ5380085.1 hypothetical protein N7496_002513 [Penicillium cataractarum]
MCGRYALGVRLAYIQQQLQERGMQVDEAPEDEEVRETYNFAPGSFGAIYRADVPEPKSRSERDTEAGQEQNDNVPEQEEQVNEKSGDTTAMGQPKYKLQSMKWGLIPFWTKRQPDYGSMLRTINCRDDSLIENRGMWTTMKQRKRCLVICQGFYEWLKKGPGGKEKVPHFVRRKDGDLMCFAGLWDCVKYEDSDQKLYTYTVITTSSNSYLKFLHDRMPVIMDYGSEEMRTWLDPSRKTWSKELQSILKPYEGELECYPVSKEVGKVGNNSPDFIIPVNSKENKSNIANFFAHAKAKDASPKKEPGIKVEGDEVKEHIAAHGTKREYTPEIKSPDNESKKQKVHPGPVSPSLQKFKTRSATHNKPMKKAGASKPPDGSQRITNFFKK